MGKYLVITHTPRRQDVRTVLAHPHAVAVAAPETPALGKYGMLLAGTLDSHLKEIDQRAVEMLECPTSVLAKSEGVTEILRASNQMKWVRLMNNIRQSAEEIVIQELIYG